MARKFLILKFSLLFFTSEISNAQQLFAQGTNTNNIEFPYDAVELPGNRFALSITKATGVTSTDHCFMELVITDSLGNIEHHTVAPFDSSVYINPRDIFYRNGLLYSVALLDSIGNKPTHVHVSVWDTTLNLISERVHSVCDSGWYILESFAEMHGDRIYSIEARVMEGDNIGSLTHPLLSVYDLNGDLISRKELDTTFITTLAGGDDYSILPENLTINDSGSLYFSFAGKKISNNSWGNQPFLVEVDTSLNLVSLAEFSCWDIMCDTTYGGYFGKKLVATTGTTLFGAFLAILLSDSKYRNSVAKIEFPQGMVGSSIKPERLEIVPDNTTGFLVTKTLGRNAISAYNNRIFTLGLDFHSYSSAVNNLIITRADTNGQIIWTRYIESDGRPFEPRFILATSDGGCLVAAIIYNVGLARRDHYIFKLDGNGHFTSVQRLELEKERAVKVFPNPATTVLNFVLDKAGEYSIVISDMNGRSVMQNKVKGASQTFEVSHLAEGMYQYAVYGAEGVIDSGLWLKQ